MKKKLLITLTAVFVLGLAMAVYAFNKTNHSSETAAVSCCAKSGACPMKNHTAQTAENHLAASCCDMDDCCCKTGDACPLKNKEAKTAMKNAGGDCCCDSGACCKHKT